MSLSHIPSPGMGTSLSLHSIWQVPAMSHDSAAVRMPLISMGVSRAGSWRPNRAASIFLISPNTFSSPSSPKLHVPTHRHNQRITAWKIAGPSDLPFLFSPRLAEGQKGLKVENKAFFSRLTFFNVSEQDYGNYTCVASNQLGNTNASMILYGE